MTAPFSTSSSGLGSADLYAHRQADAEGPSQIVEALTFARVTTTRALDVGAGTGRNAIYLAKQGIRVDAIDKSELTINNLNRYAKMEGLPIKAIVHDFRERDLEFRGFDLVLFILSLHHLSPTRAETMLSQARMEANRGTLHVIAAIRRLAWGAILP
jgi:2-polyprenyl-3-methyl-5-hydroxy-6-metoxy-1,4-benzoquinol methylase